MDVNKVKNQVKNRFRNKPCGSRIEKLADWMLPKDVNMELGSVSLQKNVNRERGVAAPLHSSGVS